MKTILGRAIASLCVVGTLAVCAAPAGAQTSEVKEKPKLYTYASSWVIPRAHFDEMEKDAATNQKILEGALANGTITGYGDDMTVVHQAEGPTHDGWWTSSSVAGLMKVLDEFHQAKPSPVLATATKHWDNILVSRYYGMQAGSVKGGYLHGAQYKLKPDAPNDAVDTLSKSLVVPLFEKLMADGTVKAYQVAEENVHTADPSFFFIYYITANAEGLDKVNAAVSAALAGNSLAGPAFGAMVDFSAHRDELARANATFK